VSTRHFLNPHALAAQSSIFRCCSVVMIPRCFVWRPESNRVFYVAWTQKISHSPHWSLLNFQSRSSRKMSAWHFEAVFDRHHARYCRSNPKFHRITRRRRQSVSDSERILSFVIKDAELIESFELFRSKRFAVIACLHWHLASRPRRLR